MSTQVTWSADSISGTRKPVNDDSFIVFTAGAKTSTHLDKEGTHTIADNDIVLAVSDGMGGGNAGDLASQILVNQLSQIIPKTIKQAAQGFTPDYLEQLEEALQQIHLSINQQADEKPELKGMAATITLAWLTPTHMHVGHVGDSRLYLHRDKKTQQISEDHNYIWRQHKRGTLSEILYRMHPQRNLLYEVVGAGHHKLTPFLLSIPYMQGDRFMLCSDGIIDGLSEKKIHLKLSQNEDSTKSTQNSLMTTAIENSGEDDTTCIVFDLT